MARNHSTSKLSKILLTVLVVLVAFFGWKYFSLSGKVETLSQQVSAANFNAKVLTFADLFIEKILRATGEVDFETRLQLENAVRDLDNPEILTAWQRFTSAETQFQAQEELKSLLTALIRSIKPAA